MRKRRHEAGFTLVELLVVIAVLGILAAVVVFAVQGVGDKGRTAAVSTDARIIRTAEEAFCSKFGRYGTMDELVNPPDGGRGFLTEASTYHTVNLSGGGPCGNSADRSKYDIDCRTLDCDSVATPLSQWSPAADLHLVSARSRSVLLGDGTVLHVGHLIAEVFDPSGGTDGRGSWTPTLTAKPAGLPLEAVLLGGAPSATCINCGKALVHLSVATPNDAWYLYDPSTGAWTSAGVPTYKRAYGAGVAVLEEPGCSTHCGKVLVVGGDRFVGSDTTAELFDPRATGNPWTTTGRLSIGRQAPATRLANGKVLVVGVEVGFQTPTTAEIYDPGTEEWTMVTPSPRPSSIVAATLLADNRVLLVGSREAQVYDPISGTWSPTGPCECFADGFGGSVRAVRLFGGEVLVVGGKVGLQPPDVAYVYNPAKDVWTATERLNEPRDENSVARLQDGRVLIAGGFGKNSGPLATAELYSPGQPRRTGG